MTYENVKVNSVPSITWNWLKSNNDVVSVNAVFSTLTAKITKLPKGVSLSSKIPENFPQIPSGTFNRSNPKSKDNRCSDGSISEKREYQTQKEGKHPLQELLDGETVECQYLEISEKIQEPIILNFDYKSSSLSKQIIHAKSDSQALVILIFRGKADTSLLQTKVYAEQNSNVQLVKVQLLDNDSLFLDDTCILEEDNAEVNFNLIELGGLHIDSGLHVNLKGFHSRFHSNTAYICKENQYLDMNHTVYHYGKKTECTMKAAGTIKDRASKVYRGTLDFKNGCQGSIGNEMDETLILSPQTMNKSFPIILCDEEDIQGEHGSTSGRLSSDLLFYMQTRGISQKAAEEIMARAKVQAVTELIPDSQTKSLISDFLDNKE